MVLIKSPVSKTGQIRYFEFIKISLILAYVTTLYCEVTIAIKFNSPLLDTIAIVFLMSGLYLNIYYRMLRIQIHKIFTFIINYFHNYFRNQKIKLSINFKKENYLPTLKNYLFSTLNIFKLNSVFRC